VAVAPIEDEGAFVVVQIASEVEVPPITRGEGAVLEEGETSGEAAMALEGEVAVRIGEGVGVASKEGEGLIVGAGEAEEVDLHPENREGECTLSPNVLQ